LVALAYKLAMSAVEQELLPVQAATERELSLAQAAMELELLPAQHVVVVEK
jgi:hypothetical protein